MHRKSAIAVLLISASLATACGGESSEQTVTEEQLAPVAVRTATVQMSEVPLRFEAPGTVRAAVSTVISSRASGRIETLSIEAGERVRKDQLIAEIDSRDAAARLRGAEAGLLEASEMQQELERSIGAAEAAVKVAASNRDLAQTTLTRYTVLRDRKSVSPQEFDEVQGRLNSAVAALEQANESLAASQAKRSQLRARIDQAKAAVDSAQVAVSDYKITSPIDGIVIEKRAEAGMLASPGMPLVAIEDDSRYELEVAVEEARLSGIRMGQQAAVEIGALGRPLTGRVVRILPVGDPASRTYTVRIELPRAAGRSPLRSGFFGRAIFDAGKASALVIPQTALVDRGELSGVYVVHEGVAVFRILRTGSVHGGQLEVMSGLKPGERIVVAPDASLRDGSPVEESPAP